MAKASLGAVHSPLLSLGKSVLESALHPRIQGVQAVQSQCLSGAEAAPGKGIGPVVAKDAVRESVQLRLREARESPRALRHELLAERHVPDERARLAQRNLGAELELERLAYVVEDRGGQQEVGVEPRVQRAGLERERRDRHGVLQQAAEVGVVAPARARRAPELRAALL